MVKSGHMPIISVIMPAFPQVRGVNKAIESILNQSCGDFEFIILNNSPSTRTSAIFEKYKDNRIKIINLYQDSIAYALNRGLQVAKGEYIARMEADDVSSPDRFEKQLEFLKGHPDVGLVGSWFQLTEGKGDIIETFELETDHENIMRHLLHKDYFSPGTVMFRKNCAEIAGGYDESLNYLPDYDLWLKISNKYQLACIGRLLHQIKPRWRQGISLSLKKKKQEELSKIKNSYFKSISVDNKLFNRIKQNLACYCNDNVLYENYKRLLPQYETPESRYFYLILNCVREPENAEHFNNLTRLYEKRQNKTLAFRSALRSLDKTPRQPELYEKLKKQIEHNKNDSFPQIDLKPNSCAVSVIMPTYNRVHTIHESIQSVLDQTFQDFELIIINDGGSDELEDEIQKYNSTRIKYFKIDHIGLAGALNAGLKQARGKYISYLDDDDVYYSTHLERLFKSLEQKKSALAYSKSLVVKGHYSKNRFVREKAMGTFTQNRAHMKIHQKCVMSVLNVMHLKSALKKTGGFNEELPWSMDWDLWVRFAKYFNFGFLDEFTGEYRKTNKSMSIREHTKGLFYMNETLRNYYTSDGGRSIMMYAAYHNNDRKLFNKYYDQIVKNLDVLDILSVQQMEKLRVINKNEGKIGDPDLIKKLFNYEPGIFVFLLYSNRKIFQEYLYKPWFYKEMIRYFLKKNNLLDTIEIFKKKLPSIKSFLSGRILA